MAKFNVEDCVKHKHLDLGSGRVLQRKADPLVKFVYKVGFKSGAKVVAEENLETGHCKD